MNNWGEFAAFCIAWSFFGSILYGVYAFLRRRQQNGMQKHLLDKFSSASDLAQFLQSPAGQSYTASLSGAFTSSRNAVLGSVRLGIILIFAGTAFMVMRLDGQGPRVAQAIGVLGIMLGIGFLVSAVASWFIAKKVKSEGVN